MSSNKYTQPKFREKRLNPLNSEALNPLNGEALNGEALNGEALNSEALNSLNMLDIPSLRNRLTSSLPGREAQYQMAFAHRVDSFKDRLDPPENAKKACILLSLWEEEGVWRTALIRRTENPRDRHSGQISFPGGRHDTGDGSFAFTALREAQEEIGIPPEKVEILGQLTELYIPVSNFSVYPFVGLLQAKPNFELQPGEVDQIFTPSLAHFQNPDNRSMSDVLVGGQVAVKNVPCFMIEDRPIWGATAMILSEFLALIA